MSDAQAVPESEPLPRRRMLAWPPWTFGAGPAVGNLFGQLFAIISLIAWLSLGVQVSVLIGSRGLLPAADFMASVRSQPELSFWQLPTMFWWFQSDAALRAGVTIGAALSVIALSGVGRRLCFLLSTLLYLSFANVARDFLSFQWDNLLLECGLLAVFLRADAPAPLVHLLFRVLLFKLYFESGIAKWQSPLADWHDGSAMTYYYETAPLPTWLAFHAHHLPAWWHHIESRATLVLELVVPLAIFGPRRARLIAAAILTLFQIGNAATANYGFFCYLALALHVFLLDDRDVERARAGVVRFVPAVARRAAEAVRRVTSWRMQVRLLPDAEAKWLGRGGAAFYLVMSLVGFIYVFGQPGPALAFTGPLFELSHRLRVVNSYHLFASITRERIEPEFQTLAAGQPEAWTPHHLRHKPGDVHRAPDFVAPHQPRVDFQLWFYGLSFQRREPVYVSTLVERLCEDPSAVQPLFAAPLPRDPAAVRIVYWRYQFSSPAEAQATGAWWRRTQLATSRPIPCPEATRVERSAALPRGAHRGGRGTLSGSRTQ